MKVVLSRDRLSREVVRGDCFGGSVISMSVFSISLSFLVS